MICGPEEEEDVVVVMIGLDDSSSAALKICPVRSKENKNLKSSLHN